MKFFLRARLIAGRREVLTFCPHSSPGFSETISISDLGAGWRLDAGQSWEGSGVPAQGSVLSSPQTVLFLTVVPSPGSPLPKGLLPAESVAALTDHHMAQLWPLCAASDR